MRSRVGGLIGVSGVCHIFPQLNNLRIKHKAPLQEIPTKVKNRVFSFTIRGNRENLI